MIETFRGLFASIGNLLVWWIIVSPWEQIVHVRMGKRVRVMGAGIHLRIPYLDKIYRQSTRRRTTTTGTQTLTTRDGKTVTINGVLGYCISDLLKLYETVHHPEDTLRSYAQGIMSDYIATHEANECSPELIKQCVEGTLDLSEYGLGDMYFSISDYAIVRTYRLIQGTPRDWSDGEQLNTINHEQSNQ